MAITISGSAPTIATISWSDCTPIARRMGTMGMSSPSELFLRYTLPFLMRMVVRDLVVWATGRDGGAQVALSFELQDDAVLQELLLDDFPVPSR